MLRTGLKVVLLVVVSACSLPPNFISDASPVPVVAQTPDHFELSARFAFVRSVYGRAQPAGGAEAELWEELIEDYSRLGTFSPFVGEYPIFYIHDRTKMLETARAQRFNYLIVTDMNPTTGAADVRLFHVGSGGLMATTRAVSEFGGQRGFWGGKIRNLRRLERATLRIARAAVPSVEKLLDGIEARQQ